MHQIIAVFPLLQEAIRIVSGGGQVAAITSVRAKDALGVLHNAEWHFHARVVATTARAVVTPMFTFLMQTDGYNAPEMVQGKWKEWAAAADALLDSTGALKISSFDELDEWVDKLDSVKRIRALKDGAEHVKELSRSITSRFSAVWERIDFLPCALLAKDNHAEYAAKILAEVSSLGVDPPPHHKHLIDFVEEHKEDLIAVSKKLSTVAELKTLHRGLVKEFRIRTDMINQERGFSVLTNYKASSHNAGVQCMSLVGRARKNTTTIDGAEEYNRLLPEAKKLLHSDSPFMALFKDPDWVYAQSLKYPDAPTTLPDLEADVIEYDVMTKHSAENKKDLKALQAKQEQGTKRHRGGQFKKGNSDSNWSRDEEDLKLMAKDQATQVEEDSEDLSMLMAQKAEEATQVGLQETQVEVEAEPLVEATLASKKSRAIEESDEEDGDAGEAEASETMGMCEACGDERETEVIEKYGGALVCPGCKREAQELAAKARKAAKEAKGSESEAEGEDTLAPHQVDYEWDSEDKGLDNLTVQDVVDEGTGEVLYEDAIMHTCVQRVTNKSSRKISLGDHVIVNIEEEGQVVVEITKMFESKDEVLRFEGLCCYDHKQLKTIAPFFDMKKHAKNGFTKKSELVLCSNPYTFLLDETVLDKVFVCDYIDRPKRNKPTGRATFFYRYIINVVTRKVEAVRSFM